LIETTEGAVLCAAPFRQSRSHFRVAKARRHGMVTAMPAKTSTPPDQSTETPHYHGHRERLRERFHAAGPEALSDYELLEMALFPALPRRDTKPLAKALLKKFGSLEGVAKATPQQLMEVQGITEKLAGEILRELKSN